MFGNIQKIGRPGPGTKKPDLTGYYRLQLSGANANLNITRYFINNVGNTDVDEAIFLLDDTSGATVEMFIKEMRITEQSYNWSSGTGTLWNRIFERFGTTFVDNQTNMVEGTSQCDAVNNNVNAITNEAFNFSYGNKIGLQMQIDPPTVVTSCIRQRSLDIYLKFNKPITIETPSWISAFNYTITEY